MDWSIFIHHNWIEPDTDVNIPMADDNDNGKDATVVASSNAQPAERRVTFLGNIGRMVEFPQGILTPKVGKALVEFISNLTDDVTS